jgi:hypothetical protein
LQSSEQKIDELFSEVILLFLEFWQLEIEITIKESRNIDRIIC